MASPKVVFHTMYIESVNKAGDSKVINTSGTVHPLDQTWSPTQLYNYAAYSSNALKAKAQLLVSPACLAQMEGAMTGYEIQARAPKDEGDLDRASVDLLVALRQMHLELAGGGTAGSASHAASSALPGSQVTHPQGTGSAQTGVGINANSGKHGSVETWVQSLQAGASGALGDGYAGSAFQEFPPSGMFNEEAQTSEGPGDDSSRGSMSRRASWQSEGEMKGGSSRRPWEEDGGPRLTELDENI